MARKRDKQQMIPGTEPVYIQEIVDAAESYVDIRDQRMELTTKEVAAHDKLKEVMEKHNQQEYQYDGKVVRLKLGKTKVKVRSVDSDSDEAEEENEAEVEE